MRRGARCRCFIRTDFRGREPSAAAPIRKGSLHKDDCRMNTCDFPEPIFVWIDPEDPGKGTRRIECVEEAIAALFRADISAYASNGNGRERAVWTAALHHLSSAKADGEAASVHSAHGAMRQLVHAVGILAPHEGML
jgi:hypothetical protein